MGWYGRFSGRHAGRAGECDKSHIRECQVKPMTRFFLRLLRSIGMAMLGVPWPA